MTVKLLTTPAQLEQLAPEWREIESAGAVALPFVTSDWVICWWRHLSENRRALRERLFTVAVREESGRLIGVAPMMITERPAAGPFRARCLQFIGADANFTEVRALLARDGHEEAVYRAVAEEAHRCRSEWDWMKWTGVHSPGAGPAIVDAAGGEWVNELPDWVLLLPPTWDELRFRLSRNLRESLRKCANAPARAGIEFRFEVLTQPQQMGPALDRFFELHAARARLKSSQPHPDRFQSPVARRFLRDLCGCYAERGIAQVFQLKHGDSVVATRIGFRLGTSLYLYLSGYDPAYAKYSAMTSCLVRAIRWAIEAGLKTVNLSTGTDVSKTRWRPEQHTFREARLISPSLRSRAAHAVYSWAERRFGAAREGALWTALGRRRA